MILYPMEKTKSVVFFFLLSISLGNLPGKSSDLSDAISDFFHTVHNSKVTLKKLISQLKNSRQMTSLNVNSSIWNLKKLTN